MSHNIKGCTGCKTNKINGCSTRRLEIFAAYTVLKGGSAPRLTFVAAGGKKPSKKPLEKPHDLEGLNLDQMAQKVQELLDNRGEIQSPAVSRPARPTAASALVLQFSVAMS